MQRFNVGGWLLAAALLATFLRAVRPEVAVLEGDTDAEMYVNGVYVRLDGSLPVLPMNNMRKQLALGNTVKVYRTSASIVAGDVIGIKVRSSRSTVMTMEDELGDFYNYSGYSAVIAALDDGTMTSTAWKCSQDHVEPETPDDGYVPWHSKYFIDDDWPQAVQQADDCCPWRDTTKAWEKLNAQWISAPWPEWNYTNARLFYCRYRVPEEGAAHPQELLVEEGARLPFAETENSTLFYSEAVGCQPGYALIAEGCFRHYTSKKSFTDAWEICNASAFGAALASIDNEQQNNGVHLLAAGGQPLIGINDRDVEGEWRNDWGGEFAEWLNFNVTNLEPDGKEAENCAAIFYDSGQWNDVPCTTSDLYSGFVCRSEACRDFSGVWIIDPYGYATENLTQSVCKGFWDSIRYTVLANKTTLRTGLSGELQVNEDHDLLLWDNGVTWVRHRASPVVNITQLMVASSGAQVSFNISRRSQVSCGIVDARYWLRTPTALELEEWGTTVFVDPTEPQYVLIGDEMTGLDYEITVLATYDVVIIEECEELCKAQFPACIFMSFFWTGTDLATGRNCRLAQVWDQNKTKGISLSALFTHKALMELPITHDMPLTGMLVPGAIYHAFCSTRDPYTEVHSKLDAIKSTQITERTEGAVDAGALNKPRVFLLGGYASTTSLVPVAQASREGRIFCAARLPADVPGNWTAADVKADGMFNILVIANLSVPVTITGLQPETEYEVACVADADGGAESSSEDIQATARRWHTERLVPTISAMNVETEEDVVEPGTRVINTYVQITEIGYLWCFVVSSNVTMTLGVPRASTIESDGLVQKVEDLRQAAAGAFPGYFLNTTYEVYCTAEKNDFSNETNSEAMKSPYPVAEILQHEVGEDRVELTVRVDRGPASIFCRAFRWSMRPTGRSPSTPLVPSGAAPLAAPREGNGLDLQTLMFTSPFRFDLPQIGGGIAILDLAPIATGSYHDVYCYAEEIAEDVPPGAEPPPRQGMTAEAIRKTRLTIKTGGPTYEEGGWQCVSGRPCNISGLRADVLTDKDRVLVRPDACPGICICNGKEDPLRKGAECSGVLQDPDVSVPLPGNEPDRLDPRGEWCYVDAGACADGEPSSEFPELTISYRVCSYSAPAGKFSAPQGFPRNGLAIPTAPQTSVAFTLHILELDCPRLTQWAAYVNAFETNLKQPLLIAIGSSFGAEDVVFTYQLGTNLDECFVHTSIRIPIGVNAFGTATRVRTASADWLLADMKRRLEKINMIKMCFTGYDNTVDMYDISDPTVELDPPTGTAFTWGPDAFVAHGAHYHLCFCNGTETNCKTERDYRLSIGLLHYSGPTEEQASTTSTCVGGLPCEIPQLNAYAAANGSRLVVLPESDEGCLWRRRSLGHAPGVPGFPNYGVSDPATAYGAHYIWAGEPLVVASGFYVLCWCGPAIKRTHPDMELDVPYAEGGFVDICPSARPDDGEGFLAPAGRLRVTGPDYRPFQACSIGLECTVADVTGEGVQGGDRVAVLRACGEEPPDSDRFEWTTQSPDGSGLTTTVTTTTAFGPPGANELEKWIEGGWLDYGPELLPQVLDTIGIGGETGRGMWGFPNLGISAPNAREGFYRWPGPLWALAGDYALCWCAAGSGQNTMNAVLNETRAGDGAWCTSPEHFLVPMGTLQVTGPGVLPKSSQVFQCVRRRGCEINNYEGTMPEGSKLLIAEKECGGDAMPGSPNGGESLPSKDGSTFDWGSEPTFLTPGLYRMCWCAAVVTCFKPPDFAAYAGLLRIKAPLTPQQLRFCPLGRECNITGIYGPGLHNGDRVAALAVCGEGEFTTKFTRNGVSIATYGLGETYTLPTSLTFGRFRVCWCAGETLCVRGADFDTDLGGLEVGGPDASAVYVCFEWQPCSIPAMEGSMLRAGDMLRVVPAGTDCAATAANESGPELVEGFPGGGVAVPAEDDGHRYTWGEGLVRAEPGMYDLCYCSFESSGGCTAQTDFYTHGGSLRVGTSKEYQYVTRPADNEERSNDPLYAVLLAVVLPSLFCLAGVVGWGRKRLCGKSAPPGKPGDHEAEAPPLFKARQSFAEMAQRKTKEMHQVKKVLEIRLAAPGFGGGSPAGRKHKKASPKGVSHIADMPDFRFKEQKQQARDAPGWGSESPSSASYGGDEEVDEMPALPGSLSGGGEEAITNQPLPAIAEGKAEKDVRSPPASPTGPGGRRPSFSALAQAAFVSEEEDKNRPKPPSTSFSNYKRCAAVMELLDMDE